MLSKQTINRSIIIAFMILVGYCFAKAIYTGSVMGILLACVSLGAGVYFLYILAKAKQEMDEAEERL
jgi:general stress protein CsbA